MYFYVNECFCHQSQRNNNKLNPRAQVSSWLLVSLQDHLLFPLCFLYTCWAELQGLIYHPPCSFTEEEGIKGSFNSMKLSLMMQRLTLPLGSPGHRGKWHWHLIRWHQHSSLGQSSTSGSWHCPALAMLGFENLQPQHPSQISSLLT